MTEIRNNWSLEEVKHIYNLPILELVYKSSTIHRKYHDPKKIKISTLISVKTGACVEDCAYCAQSSRYKTGIVPNKFMSKKEVVEAAIKAKERGATRICLSASWKKVGEESYVDSLVEMAKEIRNLDMNVCCTLGSIEKEKVQKLIDAGITGYNHNLDTSRNFYPNIITTRTYDDRLDTINNLIESGMPYCSGGIIGMGETDEDRINLLHTLATQKKHPFSVPLNTLVPVKGTPLGEKEIVSVWEIIRMVATARILMPEASVSLAAGRINMSGEGQALCYLAGANAVFIGKKLLTTKNTDVDVDMKLFEILGLKDE